MYQYVVFSIAELPVSDLSVGRWGAGIWYKTETYARSRNADNCKTQQLLGKTR